MGVYHEDNREVIEWLGTTHYDRRRPVCPQTMPELDDPTYYWRNIEPRVWKRLVEPIVTSAVTRRAVLVVDEVDGHVPCYSLFHTLLRGKTLYLIVYQRSSDVQKWEQDLEFFRWLAWYVAVWLRSFWIVVEETQVVVTRGSSHQYHKEVP